jgi:opacity protein-like surface antigen
MQSLTRTLSASAIALAALAAGGVHAQTATNNYSFLAPGSSYIGLNAGQSRFSSLDPGAGGFSADNKDTSYSVYGGSYFNRNLGVELGYTNFGQINRAGGNTKAEGFDVSLVGRLPLNDSFSLLGKVGTTYGRTTVSADPSSGLATGNESGFGLTYGIGAEYSFTPAWSAVVQYDQHDLKYVGASRERVGNTSVGVRYRF